MSWQNTTLMLLLRTRVKPASTQAPDVAQVRARTAGTGANAALRAWLPKLPRGFKRRPVPGPGGARGSRSFSEWIEPTDAAAAPKTILYLHGGGYFFCSPRTHRSITYTLAAGTGARVFVPDYRLAPEWPFPAALEDALHAYRALIDQGVPARSIVVAGDSAGGGLALSLLLVLRDAGDALPAAGVLFSPWTDLALTGATLRSNAASDAMFTPESVAHAAAFYLGATPATHPGPSPLYGDFAGLPPLLIHASDNEILLADATRVVEKARASGVDVVFKSWHGVPHAFQLFTPFLPEAREALADACRFIDAA
ncbi:MAG: alpha/beta hydrolase [Janthinobacterium lividum]